MAGFDLRKFIEKLRRSWLVWVPLAILAILFVNALGFLLPPRYESEATVRVYPSQSDGNAIVKETLSPDDRLKTLKQEITDFNFISKVAGQVGIGTSMHPDSKEYDRLIRGVIKDVTISVPTGDIFRVSYTGDSPELTQRVVEAILKEYFLRSNAIWENRAKLKVTFYEGEKQKAELKLAEVQEEIRLYKEANSDTIPEALIEHQKRMGNLQTQQQIAEQELRGVRDGVTMLEQRRQNMKENVETQRIRQPNDVLTSLNKEKRELDSQLKSLLENYTEQHPDVIKTKNRLKLVEDDIAQQEEAPNDTVTTELNPQFVALQDAITALEIKRSSLLAQIDSQRNAMTELQKLIDLAPASELDLTRRMNELRMAQDKVAQLTTALNQAIAVQAIESEGQGPTFEVVNQPRKPTSPSSPNRAKIGAVSVVFGGGIAMALVLLLTLMDTAVRSVEEARGLLKMPVLGVVQRIVSMREEARLRRRRRFQLASVATLLLLISASVVMGVTVYREPLAKQLKVVQSLIQK